MTTSLYRSTFGGSQKEKDNTVISHLKRKAPHFPSLHHDLFTVSIIHYSNTYKVIKSKERIVMHCTYAK